MNGPVQTARDAWGAALPDWVARLAEECELTSQSRVARRLGRSASVVSGVIRAKYPGDTAAIEELVRGVFMKAVVDCHALGKLPTSDCQHWRRKARSFEGHNTQRVTMYRACTRCPRFQAEAEHG